MDLYCLAGKEKVVGDFIVDSVSFGMAKRMGFLLDGGDPSRERTVER